jgi:hypothetical protein
MPLLQPNFSDWCFVLGDRNCAVKAGVVLLAERILYPARGRFCAEPEVAVKRHHSRGLKS